MLTLYNCTLILRHGYLHDGAVVIDDQGLMTYVGRASGLAGTSGESLDLGGHYLSPGFIDIHVHGGMGVAFGEGDLAQTTADYSRWVVKNGVTGYLMSVAQETYESLLETIITYGDVFSNPPMGAIPLGLHLEGPYLNVEKKGAFNPKWLRLPDVEETAGLIKAARGWIRQITIAPELPQASQVARFCREEGILVAMGHTNCAFEEARAALKSDFQHVTHTFNAQRGFDHRAPGVFGAVLTSDVVTAEVIADTVHVHPGAIQLLLRCLGTERVIAVTDAMSGTGLPEGKYHLVGREVVVRNGRATNEDGTLAGSVATMDLCVRNLVTVVGLPLFEAVNLASANPARVLGMAESLGSLENGKIANLTVFDDAVNILMTVVKGRVVYNRL